MKKRRIDPPEERRKERVEINLMAEDEGPRHLLSKTRRGCTLPFTVGVLVLIGLEVLRSIIG